MKLTDLDPHWVGHGGEGVKDKEGNAVPYREIVGLGCDCPCGCGSAMFIPFANPPDGEPPVNLESHHWTRTGDTLETLTLTPSIQRMQWTAIDGALHGCKWHGFITNGDVTNV